MNEAPKLLTITETKLKGAMTFELREDQRRNVILLRYYGDVDLKDLWNARLELASLVKKTGIKNVVIDMRGVKLNLDSVDEYQFSNSNIKYLPRGTEVATVITENDPFIHDHKYMEEVSLNRGFPIRIFTNAKEAKQWLFSES
jgi:hypothetical protein